MSGSFSQLGVADSHLDVATETRVGREARKKREGDEGPSNTDPESEDPRKYKVSKIQAECCRLQGSGSGSALYHCDLDVSRISTFVVFFPPVNTTHNYQKMPIMYQPCIAASSWHRRIGILLSL